MRFEQKDIGGPAVTEVVKAVDLTNESAPGAAASAPESGPTEWIGSIDSFARAFLGMLQTIDEVVGILAPVRLHDLSKKQPKYRVIESKNEGDESGEHAENPGPGAENGAGPGDFSKVATLIDEVIAGEGDITLSKLKEIIADGGIMKYVAKLIGQ